MENLYNRVDNLDELIRSVKLPYLSWKVLFLVDKRANRKQISETLDLGEDEISKALDRLVKLGLIFLVEDEETVPETQEETEAKPEPEIIVQEESPEEEQGVEETEEEIQEESVVPEEKPVEEEIESDTVEDLTEKEEFPEVEETPEEISPEESIDEPVEESLEDEENIDIAITEDETEDTEDLEFNFNLTDQEESTSKEAESVTEEAPQAEGPVVTEAVDKSGFKKILVIDDSLVIRKMVEIALEEENFQIETAVSGKEGLEVLDQANPDLVILDMMLPDINGIEILKTIKASKGLPVIMLSGKDSPQMIETAKAEGAEEFLPKPFKDDDLVEKIKKLLS